jgi:putative transposase
MLCYSICTQHEEGKATCIPVFETFIQPGKPAQNAFIERFNRMYLKAVLDAFLYHTVAEVQTITEDWLEECNAIRPHEALGHVAPYQYVLK